MSVTRTIKILSHMNDNKIIADGIVVDKLSMVNYKKFKSAEISFERDLTVIVGKNGAGKSSVLSALSIVLSWYRARLQNEKSNGQYITEVDILNGNYNAKVSATINSREVVVPNAAIKGKIREYSPVLDAVRDYANDLRTAYSASELVPFPMFAFYGVRRAVVEIPLRVKALENSRFDAYLKCLDGAANFRNFFTWFRMCEDWENEKKSRNEECCFHPGLEAFRTAMSKLMPGYHDIHIERHPLSMKIKKENDWIKAEQLSDGEKIFLALIGDMCYRLSLLNPEGDPLYGSGVVLIDELDLHLHPQWQSEIATGLVQTFPNIQFVVTTHSPHVINSIPTRCIRMLDENGEILTTDYGYGMPSEVVLSDIMSLKSDVPEEVYETIGRFYRAISDKDVSGINRSISKLESIVPKHPELSRMRKISERFFRK